MEKGYEIIFIMPQNRRHKGKLVSELIEETAKNLGINRMTKRMDNEGRGDNGHLHSAHFFELADQPMEIIFVLDRETGERLLDAVRETEAHVFFVRKEVFYGELGRS